MESTIDAVRLFLETEFFAIFKTTSERYYVYEYGDCNNNLLTEVEIVSIDNDANKGIDKLVDVDFDYDYSGEELEGTNYYYFKIKKQ